MRNFKVCAILFFLFAAGCTISANLNSLNSSSSIDSVDPEQSKIEVPAPAQGIADGTTPLVVYVYALNANGKAVKGFKPELLIYGRGEHQSQCEKVEDKFATCKVTATEAGDKLIFSSNSLIKRPGLAYFAENEQLSKLLVKQNNVPANGTAKVLVEVQVKNKNGSGLPGVYPILYVNTPNSITVDCSVSDSTGMAHCRLNATEPGTYEVKAKRPKVNPATVTFIEPSLKVIEGRAFADGTSKVTIDVKSTTLPILKSQPASVSILCSAVADGHSLCDLTSTTVGAKVISVDSPTSIGEIVEVFFANSYSMIAEAVGQRPPIANGFTEHIVEVVIKDDSGNPISGIVPLVDVVGSGINSIRCEESDATEKAICFISSTEPGDKKLVVRYPVIKDSLTLSFESSPVVLISQQAPADEHSPVILEIATGSEEV